MRVQYQKASKIDRWLVMRGHAYRILAHSYLQRAACTLLQAIVVLAVNSDVNKCIPMWALQLQTPVLRWKIIQSSSAFLLRTCRLAHRGHHIV